MEGTYQVALEAVKLVISQRDGSDMFIVECRITEATPGGNRVGDIVSWVKNLSKNPKLSLGEVKAFIAAMAGVREQDIEPEHIKKAVVDDGENFFDERMSVDAFNKPTRAGGTFTVVRWGAPREAPGASEGTSVPF